MIAVYLIFTLLFFYTVLLAIMAYGYLKSGYFITTPLPSQTPISIIICARNEEKHIFLCLKSILAQRYNKSLLQVIVVNDASTDHTHKIAKSILETSGMNFTLINNTAPIGKKASISKAMELAQHPTIITRDADTFNLSTEWLNNLAQFKEAGHYDLVIGPVAIAEKSGLLWALQCVENNVLTVLSAGSAYFKKPFLCSGANLLFTKAIFEKVNGYQSHGHIASGDDVLFLEDVKKTKGARIGFLKAKSALVYTYPQFRITQLLVQKVRWAQKFKHNPNVLNLTLSLLTFSVNAAWVMAFIGFFLHAPFHNYLLVFVLLKLMAELFLLFLSRRFMTNKHLFWYAFAVALVYPFYALVVALLSLFVQPKWK
jgi:cellulose synthase/poly-beta-1,6-N-acetylglucosamine synthase-like glycosyltransferase